MGNALAKQSGIPNDIYTQIATNVKDIDVIRCTNSHFAKLLGEPTYEFQTDTVTSNDLAQAHGFITKLIVITCFRWPKLNDSINYCEYFPHLKHLVLQSCISDCFEIGCGCIASLQKLLKDCSPKLESIELTYIKPGHYAPTIQMWSEMMDRSSTVGHLKLSANIFPLLNMPFINKNLTNVHNIHVVMNPEAVFQWKVDQGFTQPAEFLWNWATTRNRKHDQVRSLTLEIPEWNFHVQKVIDFRCRSHEFQPHQNSSENQRIRKLIRQQKVEAMNRLSDARSDGLAMFTLSAQVHTPVAWESSTFNATLLDHITKWQNTLECFIKPVTNVTLNFSFVVVENIIELPLLERLMLFMTTRASTVHINIAIPQERGNYNSLFPMISQIYENIYSSNHRPFGGMVLTIRVVTHTLANDQMHIYNEHDHISEMHVGALIKIGCDILHT
jgi:hypothetical protein